MNPSLKQHIGVIFSRNTTTKKWKVQLTRLGKTFCVGYFENPEVAARAYDNAAYYLREWGSQKAGLRLNFPAEWDDELDLPPIMDRVLQIRIRLREAFPKHEESIQKRQNQSKIEQVGESAMEALAQIEVSMKTLKPAISFMTGRVAMLESENARLLAEHAMKDRTIEGLQALRSGVVQMRKIEVDSHLGSPQNPGQ